MQLISGRPGRGTEITAAAIQPNQLRYTCIITVFNLMCNKRPDYIHCCISKLPC